jgi:penicillin-binding protein 2
MIEPPEDRRPPLTPQLALRVAILGGVVLAMFAIVFFRLWFLQVLSGEQYLKLASSNRVREVAIPAPRGDILDASGNPLVTSKQAIAVQISPPDLPVPLQGANPASPPRRDGAVFRRLAGVLRMPTRATRCKVPAHDAQGRPIVLYPQLGPIPCAVAQQQAQLPYANVTVKTDVSTYVQYYLAERADQFPGVHVTTVYTRAYPLGDTAAQLFGTVGPISPQQVHQTRYRRVSQNAIIGQSGLEYYYDRYLRGRDGADNLQVDATGSFKGYLPKRKPVVGHSLKLSLDVSLQKAGQQALAEGIANNPPATAGAFVALDPDTGAVLAMGSAPTFNPGILTKPITQARYNQLLGPSAGYPQFNRAIQSGYPTGSTFKGITATAALQSGLWGLGQAYDDNGVYTNGAGNTRHNAGNAVYGVIDIVQAIMVSSDNFFYNLGRRLNVDPATHPNGGPLQQWASAYGIGRPTGIDLGGENAGILPTPAWRAHNNARERAYERAHHKPCCTLGDLRSWSVGDNENLAVGQGDLEATPLQLAVAYSAIANGGKVVRPHVGLEVDAQDGTLSQKIDPPPARYIHIAPANLDAIRQGLRNAASQPGGTSADVFSNFPEPVYGKTGTAQHNGQQDQAWYVCFVPSSATRKPILVVVTVEQGGFGAVGAAPVAREILSQWFFGKRGPYVAGSSKTL